MRIKGTTYHPLTARNASGQHEVVYNAWVNMRQRCNNSNKWDYKFYGGKGIKVCERWQNFSNFFEDMGHPPSKHSLDRIDSNKDYSPDNCRWASKWEQSNNRTYNHLITYKGKTQSIGRWAKDLPFSITTKNLNHRIVRGWTIERALTQPPK